MTIPLNRKRVAVKVKVHLESVRIEIVELTVRQSLANLGARHGRLIGQQSGRRGSIRLHHGKWSQLHGDDARALLLLLRAAMESLARCGIGRDNSALRNQAWM
jgi:hypothetical protein